MCSKETACISDLKTETGPVSREDQPLKTSFTRLDRAYTHTYTYQWGLMNSDIVRPLDSVRIKQDGHHLLVFS